MLCVKSEKKIKNSSGWEHVLSLNKAKMLWGSKFQNDGEKVYDLKI